jgi:hypothetical protein
MTRSITDSSSSARGAVTTVTSTSGISVPMALAISFSTAATRSSGKRAAHRDRDFRKQARAGRAHAHAIDGDDAAHLVGNRGDAFCRARRRRVRERVDGAPPEPVAGDADEDGDDGRRDRVRPGKSERDAAEPDEDGERRPHVGAEVERIGFQRLARSLVGHPVEKPRAEKIDDNGDGDHREGPEGRLHRVRLPAQETRPGLPEDEGRQHEQERRGGEGGDALDLAVAVMMFSSAGFPEIRTAK